MLSNQYKFQEIMDAFRLTINKLNFWFNDSSWMRNSTPGHIREKKEDLGRRPIKSLDRSKSQLYLFHFGRALDKKWPGPESFVHSK